MEGVDRVEDLQAAMPQAIRDRLEAAGVLNLTCEELARHQVEQINATPGRLLDLECSECMNRGYFARLDDQYRRYNEECRCMARRRSLERIRHSGLKELLERYTLETWETPEPWQSKAKNLALQYADDPAGKWFCMAGSVGSGKSHLCTALAGLLLERGYDTLYMLWRDVSVRAKAAVNDDYEYHKIVEPLKRTRVLYIDDLFKVGKGERPTVGDVNLAFEILNYRYNSRGLMTIISSERTIDELLDIDEAVGSRIYERSRGFYLNLGGKKNWRLRE